MDETKRCPYCAEEILAAAVKCRHCGSQVPAQRDGQRAVRPFFFVLLVGVVGGLILLAVFSGKAGQNESVKPPQQPENAIAAAETETPTLQQVASEFSSFVGDKQGKLVVMAMALSVYGSRMRQDAGFNDLASMRKDSEDLKILLQSQSEDLTKQSQPLNISDDDAQLFTDVAEAADAIASGYVSAAVNTAVAANYGMSDPADDNAILSQMKKDRHSFEAAVFTGYKRLGVDAANIDKTTLTVKAAPVGRPST